MNRRDAGAFAAHGRAIRTALNRTGSIAVGCALLACVVHAHAVQNEFAMDDVPVVRDNPAAHAVSTALDVWLSPYWPDSAGASAGQYRPFTILTFAAEWSMTGGSVGWIHADNVALHGVVTGLVILVLSAWLSGLGLWVAGVIFAVHPVHVEAVAGMVGRAELLAAAALLGVILAGRQVRRASTAVRRVAWLLILTLVLLTGLFSKEHAVVAVALLALDHVLTDRSSLRRNMGMYLVVTAVTMAWLHLFRGVAGEYIEGSRAALFRGLSESQRVFTMLPVQLDVLRLLAWPFDLAADYNPQMVAQRTELAWVTVLGGVVVMATLALGAAAFRRAPAITFGIFAGVMTYAPTSNLVFASGVALAERNLYLAVLAPAAVLGWLITRSEGESVRRWVLIGIGALAVAFTGRTVERVRAWKDTRSIVIEDIVDHPENYRTRLRLASYFVTTHTPAAALAEDMVAVALFPFDPFIATRSVPRALELGYVDLAIREARRAHNLLPNHPILAELLVDSYLLGGHLDSSVSVAREAIVRAPRSEVPIRAYGRVLANLEAPAWIRVVNEARLHHIYGRFREATTSLEVALDAYGGSDLDVNGCWDIREALRLAQTLAPRLVSVFRAHGQSECVDLQF